jgi:hypothetical protein
MKNQEEKKDVKVSGSMNHQALTLTNSAIIKIIDRL